MITVAEIKSIADGLGLRIERLAPSWRWFYRPVDLKPRLFALNNIAAYDELQRILQERQLTSALMLGVELDEKRLAEFADRLPPGTTYLWARADSKAALTRSLNKLLGRGRGTGKPSCGYWVRKWSRQWPMEMYMEARGGTGIWARTDKGIVHLSGDRELF